MGGGSVVSSGEYVDQLLHGISTVQELRLTLSWCLCSYYMHHPDEPRPGHITPHERDRCIQILHSLLRHEACRDLGHTDLEAIFGTIRRRLVRSHYTSEEEFQREVLHAIRGLNQHVSCLDPAALTAQLLAIFEQLWVARQQTPPPPGAAPSDGILPPAKRARPAR
eukprot:Sspe_Gene.70333::Locus_41521_Transcript_1_1_Confidence_1.000_Length_649::g.70333::m.70333